MDCPRRHTGLATRKLLATMNLEYLWAEGGPTAQALELKNSGFRFGSWGGPNRSEAALVRLAFDFWDGTGHAPLDEVLRVLDPPTLFALGHAITQRANSPE
jgi:hypothetical protein